MLKTDGGSRFRAVGFACWAVFFKVRCLRFQLKNSVAVGTLRNDISLLEKITEI